MVVVRNINTVVENKVLITGITGFAGSHLADYLVSKGMCVFGTRRWRSRTENIDHLEGKIELIEADILDASSLRNALRKSNPDYIFHLAAQSYVPTSWKIPAETMRTNIIGTVNLLEAVCESKCQPVVQIAGSSEEYGEVRPDEIPINENNPLRPLAPHGVSKVAVDFLGYQYFKSYGLSVVRTRAFNHTGPRRGEVFVVSSFAKQIAEIEKGLRSPVIMVGNLSAVRDFTDVRDMVRAYFLAVQKCEPGEVYNIASSRGIKIETMLHKLLGMAKVQNIKLEKDPQRMRPSDVEVLIGTATKFKKITGWAPEIPFEKTLEDTLNYWRERV